MQIETDPDTDRALEQDVERRLAEIRDNPEHLMRYNIGGGGFISDGVWDDVRKIVQAEAATGRMRSLETTQQTDTNNTVYPAQNVQTLEFLKTRYAFVNAISQSTQTQSFRGQDRQSNQTVIIKELPIDQVDTLQTIEFFEHEARRLKSISHPSITKFIEFLHMPADHEHGLRSFLVEEFIDGVNLKRLMKDGLVVDESAALAFLREMLGALTHLHSLPKPIIHGDIKLSNIIRKRDQRLVLIGCNTLRSQAPSQVQLSCSQPAIDKALSYTQPEKTPDHAAPSTDLYTLATTTVHLLSRRHPADLPVVDMALQFQDYVDISEDLIQILEKMLAPCVETRFISASDVLSALDKTQPNVPPETARPDPTTFKFGKYTNQNQTLFNSWDESATPTESSLSQVLDALRPDVLLAKSYISNGQFRLRFPQTRPTSIFDIILLGLCLLFSIAGLFILSLGVLALSDLGLSDGLFVIALSILFIAGSSFIGWVILDTILFTHISIEIDDTTFHHRTKEPIGYTTISILLEKIEVVEVMPASTPAQTNHDDTDEDHVAPRIKIASRYHEFHLGLQFPIEELTYWSAEIQKKIILSRNQIAP